MKIGLFFGSFNPVHSGHLLVATHIREAAQLDEVWFVVSPQNPFKLNTELADENHRLQMVKLSIANVSYFKVVDLEFNLPKPSYTHVTLKELTKQYPEYKFQLIIGEDNVTKFNEWKEVNWILENYKVLVYNRKTSDNKSTKNLSLTTYHLPLMDISSTNIRERIKKNLPITYFVTENVEHYITFHKLFR